MQALGPVMMLQVGNEWLGVPVMQLERVVCPARLWPVPLTQPEYVGLLDNGQELVPVMQLSCEPARRTGRSQEQLVAILHVRGESVGLAIERAGQLCTQYQVDDTQEDVPSAPAGVAARRARTADSHFWLIDTDQLWQQTRGHSGPGHHTG